MKPQTVRLTPEQIVTLKEAVAALDSQARLWLFGSRVDPDAKGGDIDLIVESRTIRRTELYKIRQPFYERFGEQKIDILLDRGEPTPFLRMVKQKAVPL
ncbi:nucleotidyltransferase domain-containing protein [Hydrogenimonas sp.]